MTKYQILINTLDQIRKEAPIANKRYYPNDNEIEKLDQARARAYIHLFLKVKFGILDFSKREAFIVDDPQDGGIDAYYIDENTKRIYLIQSKFRTSEENFITKEISYEELLKMDVERIINGEENDENGNAYNDKVKAMQRKIQQIPDIGRYSYEVVILANTKEISASNLKKLSGGLPVMVINHQRSYQELLFPLIKGTFYNPDELTLSINLANVDSAYSRIDYKVITSKKTCTISVLFVPTLEIAQAMRKYKNSILQFNPRSFLELSRNSINQEIAKSISELTTNEFALFNNGITILSKQTNINQQIGQKDRGQLIIKNPQIINGGQTAFTLARKLEEAELKGLIEQYFSGKEVLLKIITFEVNGTESNDNYYELVEEISQATNQQSPVIEADRRSNDEIQIKLQGLIFEKYGYFYERKLGEFADGLKEGYISASLIINRETFIRICKSCDLLPSEARHNSARELFSEKNFKETLNDESRVDEYIFVYKCYQELKKIEAKYSRDRKNKFGISNYGNAIRYGKFAVVAACKLYYQDQNSDPVEIVKNVLSKWIEFEKWVPRQTMNQIYALNEVTDETGVIDIEIDFDNYYKGSTLNKNIVAFFKNN